VHLFESSDLEFKHVRFLEVKHLRIGSYVLETESFFYFLNDVTLKVESCRVNTIFSVSIFLALFVIDLKISCE
jgi:hypothetical protein